ncbi:MAG: FkbM family methyltransferase [Deltaproteobacteria bacterium]|jgi:FkbM family methyltransferase|nr:FkbM family methyltransferase [Deltaproteobacteria bacterium]
MGGTKEYWNERYRAKRGAGTGSYGPLAEYKAEVVNSFARDHGAESAVDLGCGDGFQSSLFRFRKYAGLDLSEEAIRLCNSAFQDDTSKTFGLYSPGGTAVPGAEIALSLDSIFCMPEDDLFERHMRDLFGAAERFAVVYSTNVDAEAGTGPAAHTRSRRFTGWVTANLPGWKLAGFLPNRFPARPDQDNGMRSSCDFYFYSKNGSLKPRYAVFDPRGLKERGSVSAEECERLKKLASESLSQGRPDEAIGHIEGIIAFQLDSGGVEARTLANYGAALTAARKLPEAAQAYRAALCLSPGDREARARLARLHLSEREWESLKDFPDELISLLEGGGAAAAMIPEISDNLPKMLENQKYKALAGRFAPAGNGGKGMAPSAARTVVPTEWENRHSPSCVLPLFAKGMAQPDFRFRLKGLLDGLDEADRAKICRIVHNLQKLASKTPDPASVFNPEEAEKICSTLDYIKYRTVKLAEDMYCFNGYFLPVPHFGPDIFVNRFGMGLLERPERLRDKDIIDVGGYCGDSAIILAEATDRKVHVFEPVPPHQDMVRNTLRFNGVENCELVPLALGERSKDSVIYFFGSGSSLSKFDKETERQLTQIKVKVIPLDEYVAENRLEVGFIKVDIEGYEQQFLEGARKTISEQRPAMSISIYHNFDDFFSIKTIIEGWGLGYRFRIAKTSDANVVVETALVCEAL